MRNLIRFFVGTPQQLSHTMLWVLVADITVKPGFWATAALINFFCLLFLFESARSEYESYVAEQEEKKNESLG